MSSAEDFTFDIPGPDLEVGWESDTLSSLEEDNWEELDDISKQKKWNKWAIHKTLGCIIPAAIAIAFILFVIALIVYVAHLLIPDVSRWLTEDELSHIHSMIFSGVVGGAIAIAARTYFLDDDK